jgi:alpha-tubulin suppressor-like RCC1 family protein
VSGISNAIGIGTGGNHSCAPTATGAILCWGDNSHGELGKGTTTGQLLSPESVVGYP